MVIQNFNRVRYGLCKNGEYETHLAWSHDKPRPLLSVFISMSMIQSLKWLFLLRSLFKFPNGYE